MTRKRSRRAAAAAAARVAVCALAPGSALGLAALPAPAEACPVCDTGTGEAVRAGLFDENFGYNLAATLLPFPVFLGIAALAYYGPPSRWRAAATPRAGGRERNTGQ